MCILLCHIYVLVLQMFIGGYNSIDPLSQCKLFQRPIICLYGQVGKWIGAVTGGNKLLVTCHLAYMAQVFTQHWYALSSVQNYVKQTNMQLPQDHMIFNRLQQKLKVLRPTDHVILRINTVPTTHSPTTVVQVDRVSLTQLSSFYKLVNR